jgi:flagellin
MNVTNATTLADNIGQAQDLYSQSLTSLSSGLAFTSPGDAPAAQAQASSYASSNGRIQAASTNIQNALSYTQTAASYLSSIQDMITRMGQLATLAQDPTKTAGDVADYQNEFLSLQSELRSTVGGSTAAIGGTSGVASPGGMFDGAVLFGSSSPEPIAIGDGPNDTLTLPELNLQQGSTAAVIGQDSSGNFNLSVSSPNAVADLTAAVAQVANAQATNGGAAVRLQTASSALQVQSENLTSAISNISDTDVAAQSTQLARFSILQQASTAMLAQANANSALVYKLLKQN